MGRRRPGAHRLTHGWVVNTSANYGETVNDFAPAPIKNRITELLGIDYPIIQAPMGWIARSPLASAVSNAGGLGIIETSSGELDNIRLEIEKMAALTPKPFGVNIAQLFVRDPSIVDFVVAQGVKFVTTSAGDPKQYTAQLKDAGLTVFHVVPTLSAALKAVVQMGTRMVSAAESPVHNNWKQAILDGAETDTVFLNRHSKPGLRAIRTERTSALEKQEHVPLTEMSRALDLYFGGDMEAAIALTGQVMGRIDAILPVHEIIHQTMIEFRSTISRLTSNV